MNTIEAISEIKPEYVSSVNSSTPGLQRNMNIKPETTINNMFKIIKLI